VVVHFIGPMPNARIVLSGISALVEQLDAEELPLDDLLDELPKVVARYGLVARLADVGLDRIEFDVSHR
jgi:hypothetical protein